MTLDLPVSEPMLRLGVFLGVLVLLLGAEALWPARTPGPEKLWRRTNNLALVTLNTLLIRLLFPTAAVGFALVLQARGWGLFNLLGTPAWISIPLSVMALDLVIYVQHLVFHRVALLWRLHRVHHADLGFDATTGLRFHPLEIFISMLVKLVAVILLGAPALAVLAFEVLLNASSLFEHANLRLPEAVDRSLRFLIVTPDMHRVHHSVLPAETNSNYGFNLAIWDRLFRTYRAQPLAGHSRMTIGVPAFRDVAEARIDRLLTQPFREG